MWRLPKWIASFLAFAAIVAGGLVAWVVVWPVHFIPPLEPVDGVGTNAEFPNQPASNQFLRRDAGRQLMSGIVGADANGDIERVLARWRTPA
jgi:hypothetical protein